MMLIRNSTAFEQIVVIQMVAGDSLSIQLSMANLMGGVGISHASFAMVVHLFLFSVLNSKLS